MTGPKNEGDLIALASTLASEGSAALSPEEAGLIRIGRVGCRPSPQEIRSVNELIAYGQDPLGDAFCQIRTPEVRRESGATYTPHSIVETMVGWAGTRRAPERIVDPGVGSARFLLAAAKAFPNAKLVGIDTDPLATLVAKANLASAGLIERSTIITGDFRDYRETVDGSTLYIGNPPYVRHHRIDPRWKNWLLSEAAKIGLPVSGLAGLHVHFFLSIALRAKRKDFGALITASEWLDVNYGRLVRALVAGRLGGQSVTVVEPTAQPFPDAATTAAITTFEVGATTKTVSFRRVAELADLAPLAKGRRISKERLASEARWSHLSRSVPKVPDGYIELGELCRVHRGQVTGSNEVWIEGPHSRGLPDSVLFPTVTRAKDVLTAEGVLSDAQRLRRVIDIPADLDELDHYDRRAVEAFLLIAKKMDADKAYTARHRKAWWAVGLRAAAPIVATYMARRAPGFALNSVGARHINIAHGLYPRQPMSEEMEAGLMSFLRHNVSRISGRTYAGGLTKFEPREMERIVVPGPEMLERGLN